MIMFKQCDIYGMANVSRLLNIWFFSKHTKTFQNFQNVFKTYKIFSKLGNFFRNIEIFFKSCKTFAELTNFFQNLQFFFKTYKVCETHLFKPHKKFSQYLDWLACHKNFQECQNQPFNVFLQEKITLISSCYKCSLFVLGKLSVEG